MLDFVENCGWMLGRILLVGVPLVCKVSSIQATCHRQEGLATFRGHLGNL